MWTTLVAGSNSSMTWAMEAAHPGDCFAYITYDTDLPDTQKRWFKIMEWYACNLNNLQTMQYNVPSYLPSCDHCVLRWEWYALHLQSISIVEYYSQCADIKIIGNPNGQLPTPQVTIPGHLPMDAQFYRPGYNSYEVLLTGPPVASIGGADWSCEATYGESCNVPAPTNNPCKISTQRCMSSSSYQACGIGATTTVWGPEQPCQTGLVCVNASDGEHIYCDYPPAGTPTSPSSDPSSSDSTPSSPSDGSSSDDSNPISNPTNDVCTLRSMRCTGESTYQTCTNGASSNYWSSIQSCQSGLYCVPTGDYIYCGSTPPLSSNGGSTPEESTATNAPEESSPSVPEESAPSVPESTSEDSNSVTESTPEDSAATGSESMPDSPTDSIPDVSTPSSNVPDTSSSNPCIVGDQKCVGESSYQTCSPMRDGSTYWAATQSCQTGLTCHASATANNVYCY